MICKSCKYYTPLNEVGRMMLMIKASAIYRSDEERTHALDTLLGMTCKYGLCDMSMPEDECSHYKRIWWMFWK